MEKEEQKRDQEELEEEENEGGSLKLRRSRTHTAETEDTTQSDSNGYCKINGHIIQPSNPVNENENGIGADESVLSQEQEGPVNIAALTDSGVGNKPQVIDGHSKSESCVYYDKHEGMWKCRICCWTFGTACLSIDLIQNPKGHLHELMIYKTLNLREPCFTFELQGTKSNSPISGEEHVVENPGDDRSDIRRGNFGVQKKFDSVIDFPVEENKKDNNLSSLQYSKILSEECATAYKSLEIKEIENEDMDLMDEGGLEVRDLDVVRVLEKQNTHDLYCPNCNSCITRRVILRKRKRRIRITSEDVKRNKLETTVDSYVTHCTGPVTDNQVNLDGSSEPAGNDYEREREPDIFRCLSCFSFFIPAGTGFKLFRIFGDKGEKKPIEDHQKSPMSKIPVSSTLPSDKERTSEPGSAIKSAALKTSTGTRLPSSNLNGENGRSFSMQKDLPPTHDIKGVVKSGISKSQEDGDKISLSSKKEPLTIEKVILNAGDYSSIASKLKEGTDTGDAAKDHFEALTGSQRNTSNISIDVLAYHQSDPLKAHSETIPVINEDSPEAAVSEHESDGLKLLISSPCGSPTPEKLLIDQNTELRKQNIGVVSALAQSDVSSKMNTSVDISREDGLHVGAMIFNKSGGETDVTFHMSNHDGYYFNDNPPLTINGSKKDIHDGELLKVDKDPLVLSVKAVSFIKERPVDIANDLRKVAVENSAGKDTVIVVESETSNIAASQTEKDFTISEETGTSTNLATHISTTESRGANAREAYGIEIIKSIVYGGIPESVISLGVVSSAAGGNTATLNILALALANLIGGLILIGHNLWDLKKEQIDRYKEQLGSRENFWVHATVAMSSFLIFGSIPPITYGFSFRKSDDDDRALKLLTVAAASFVCIVVLAIGKEYVRRPPKSYLKTILHYVLVGFMVSGVSYAVGELIKRLLDKLHFQSLLTLPTTPVEWVSS